MKVAKTLRTALAGLAIAVSAVAANAQNEEQNAFKHLTAAPYFAVGGVGFAGSITPAEKDLYVLIANKDDKKLVALTNEKNAAARMYGLLGLRYMSHARYPQLASSLAKSPATVETFSGCIRGTKTVANLSAAIAKGDYDKTIKYDMERIKK